MLTTADAVEVEAPGAAETGGIGEIGGFPCTAGDVVDPLADAVAGVTASNTGAVGVAGAVTTGVAATDGAAALFAWGDKVSC